MINETLYEFPLPPNLGIGSEGIDSFVIPPSSGYINRIKLIYINLPSNVSFDIKIGIDTIFHSNGNETTEFQFSDGIIFSQNINIIVTGSPGTPYKIRLSISNESIEPQKVQISNFPSSFLEFGLPDILIIASLIVAIIDISAGMKTTEEIKKRLDYLEADNVNPT